MWELRGGSWATPVIRHRDGVLERERLPSTSVLPNSFCAVDSVSTAVNGSASAVAGSPVASGKREHLEELRIGEEPGEPADPLPVDAEGGLRRHQLHEGLHLRVPLAEGGDHRAAGAGGLVGSAPGSGELPGHPHDAIGVLVEAVVRELVADEQGDEEAARQPGREAQDVDGGVAPLAAQAAQRDSEVVQ
jgi:hypothetical protein